MKRFVALLLVALAGWALGSPAVADQVTTDPGRLMLAQATPAPTAPMNSEEVKVEGGAQTKPADHPRNILLVEIRNLDRYAVHVKLHSKNRRWEWPAGREVYTLKDSQFHTLRLSCAPGEKICYGAGRSGNYNKFWGVGISGRNGCTSCCMECGNSYRYTLNAAR